MSDTPRTDLFEKARLGAPAEYEWAADDYRDALEFARGLEREVALLKAVLSRPITVTVSPPLEDL